MASTFGLDISSYSGVIDWPTVVKTLNPRFVFARAYHFGVPPKDSSYPDEKFNDYWSDLARLKLPRGAYMRCNPFVDPQQSVTDFFTVYTPQPGDLLPAVDVEDEWDNSSGLKPEQRTACIDKLLRGVAAKIGGQKPLLYTKQRVWIDLGNPSQFAAYPLWVMDYAHTPPASPTLPVPWQNYTFWQYAQDQQATGLADYDPDLFNGPESALRNFTIQRVTA